MLVVSRVAKLITFREHGTVCTRVEQKAGESRCAPTLSRVMVLEVFNRRVSRVSFSRFGR